MCIFFPRLAYLDVVIIGCGPVGLMASVGARTLGVDRVYIVDMVEERLALAHKFGAHPLKLEAGAAGEANIVQLIKEATGGRGCDAVLDCVGSGMYVFEDEVGYAYV